LRETTICALSRRFTSRSLPRTRIDSTSPRWTHFAMVVMSVVCVWSLWGKMLKNSAAAATRISKYTKPFLVHPVPTVSSQL